jgi:hypothetical protein
LTEEFLSRDGQYKAIIEIRKDGLFEISIYKWTEEIVPGYEQSVGSFWEPVSTPSLTDNLSNARKLTVEELKNWSGDHDDEVR